MRLGESAYVRGIALTVSTHTGPHFMYLHVSDVPIRYDSLLENDLMSDSSSEDIEWSDGDSPAAGPPSPKQLNLPLPGAYESIDAAKQHNARQNQFDESTATKGTKLEAQLVMGYEPGFFAEIMTPPRQLCNQRFELTADALTFLGIPVHILPNGTWRRLKLAAKSASHVGESESGSMGTPGADISASNKPLSESIPVKDGSGDRMDQLDGQGPIEMGADGEANESAELFEPQAMADEDPLRMFHVVFILDSPITDQAYVNDEVYHYVVTQFSKILRNEQASKGYVWDQVQKINRVKDELLTKDEATPLETINRELEQRVELCKAIKELDEALSILGIARVQINGKLRAFQVPVETEIATMPHMADRKAARFYPTTSKLFGKEISENNFESFGLLLLRDPAKILQEIQVSAGSPLAGMVNSVQPTLSIQALADENGIGVRKLADLAYALVYWRCARIIIPLHHRYVYAVSPTAPFQELPLLSREFYAKFPMMPPLQRLLSALSTGKPQPFMYHIPSRDHQEVYMQSLAWLIRRNLVVHLQTFAILLVTRRVKLAVHREMAEEADPSGSSKDNTIKQERRTDSSTDNTFKLKRQHSDTVRTHLDFDDTSSLTDSYIRDPQRASLLEKKWIAKIAASHTPEHAALFYRLLKYFNGKDCLEQVILHETLTRAELKRFLHDFAENISTFRHW